MKATKITRNISVLALSAFLCSCGSTTTEHKTIGPLPAAVSVENLQDCTVPATFKPEDFRWMGGNLSMTVYNMDLYDAVEVTQLQVGDTLIYDNYPIVIEKIVETDGGFEINDGTIEEGGCMLAPNEGGTYVAVHWDTHATYSEIGQAQVPLSEPFTFIACGENPE
ncbi:MAG: hypothetical protein HUK02_07000, partial [Bacteroidaceae bacterium]|nr:hypothetical protein [Bacteroidaceae bacterium]